MKHSNVLLSTMMVFALCTAQAQNPWEKYGYTPPKVLTLSDGKYEEFFPNDTITQIGSVMFNTITNEVVAFVDTKQEDDDISLRPEVISRFLSIDPLEKQFPMLTPYQYASNRPIDGIDIDGLEYADYRIVIHAKTGKTEFSVQPHNKIQNNIPGPEGPGVKYYVSIVDEYGKDVYSYSFMQKRTAFSDYGNYYGSTSLNTWWLAGGRQNPDYSAKPVDAVDYGAFLHDQAYDLVDAKGAKGLLNDFATIEADQAAINYWGTVVDAYNTNKSDPYNNQTITGPELNAAKYGISGFSTIVSAKKQSAALYMWQQSGSVGDFTPDTAEGWYTKWRDTYMIKTDKGWKRNESMWEKVDDEYKMKPVQK